MSTEEGSHPNGLTPKPVLYCEEGRRLLDAFGEAVQKLLQLHELQFAAIVAGESDSNRFDIMIHEASEHKQNAKYAYLAHVEAHGCSSYDAPKHS